MPPGQFGATVTVPFLLLGVWNQETGSREKSALQKNVEFPADQNHEKHLNKKENCHKKRHPWHPCRSHAQRPSPGSAKPLHCSVSLGAWLWLSLFRTQLFYQKATKTLPDTQTINPGVQRWSLRGVSGIANTCTLHLHSLASQLLLTPEEEVPVSSAHCASFCCCCCFVFLTAVV